MSYGDISERVSIAKLACGRSGTIRTFRPRRRVENKCQCVNDAERWKTESAQGNV